MIQNISAVPRAQVRANTPNFGKTIITTVEKAGTQIVRRTATASEEKSALETINALLQQPIQWFTHGQELKIHCQNGDTIALPEYDNASITHTVRDGNKNLKQKSTIEDDKNLGDNETLFDQIAAKILKLCTVSDETIGFRMEDAKNFRKS